MYTLQVPTSFSVLVIILAVMLAIFLLLSIFIAYQFIQILNHMKRISEQAEKVVNKVESASTMFQKAAAPLAFGKLFASIANIAMKKRKHKGDKDE
jgi:predicted PurR-regulated permease PerM